MSVVRPSERKIEIVESEIVEQYIRKRTEEGYAVRCRRNAVVYFCEAVKL